MKIFNTHNQQLKCLREKGLEIRNSSKAKRILETENYYTLINGYRDIFKEASSKNPFRFKKGSTFDEIHALYELDGELRNIYMKYILKIEKSFQSMCSYFFSKDNSTNNRAYLDFRNYRIPPEKRGFPKKSEIHRTISMFSNKMSNENDRAIQHHITNHQEVPLWVLVNTFTMGEIAYFYYYLKDSIRLELATYFSRQRRSEYKDKSIIVTPTDVDDFLFFAKHFRNSCAHNERFYCKKTSKIKNIRELKDRMKLYLSKQYYQTFERQINKKFIDYTDKFVSIKIDDIKKESGF